MVDPNRKININLPSDEDSSEEDDLNEEHVKMVKEFEEEFKDRFTERDELFMNFCRQKTKPPIIVYPFDNFYRHNNHHHHHRGFNRRPRSNDNHSHKYPRFSGGPNYNNYNNKHHRNY